MHAKSNELSMPGSQVTLKCYTSVEAAKAELLLAKQRGLIKEGREMLSKINDAKEREAQEKIYLDFEKDLSSSEAALLSRCLGKLDEDLKTEYYRQIKARIEDCAVNHFPAKDGKKLYGNGELAFAIDRQGQLLTNVITKSSAIPSLDEHLLKLVEASAPFGEVPRTIHQGRYKQFVVTMSFQFTQDDNYVVSSPKKKCNFKY
jgi:protein TonB